MQPLEIVLSQLVRGLPKNRQFFYTAIKIYFNLLKYKNWPGGLLIRRSGVRDSPGPPFWKSTNLCFWSGWRREIWSSKHQVKRKKLGIRPTVGHQFLVLAMWVRFLHPQPLIFLKILKSGQKVDKFKNYYLLSIICKLIIYYIYTNISVI